ncbi:MAG: Poly-beta-1,6-N-acetyl-D-glucosamine synthase [Gammaproteobacteria bacterium]|nr:Poly-beta-1,6-N-acetyl-D-glucosamine synthase [Gammaproteobacteria bacterium]
MAFDTLANGLLAFAFYYPLFMAYLWMAGGLYYYFRWERTGGHSPDDPPGLPYYPPVSVIVPCHNEGRQLEETIGQLLELDYPDFEIIAVNDGSTDQTGAILNRMAGIHPRLRVLHFTRNQGKAMGLRMAAMASPNEFLVCIDGDALLDRHAVTWMLWHLVQYPRVGAVTGNPRIRNRSTLLGRIQVGEFSSIIGLIKRAQRIYGRIFTVSGVMAAFRKSALHRVDYWSVDMVTEDIDVSWKLQLDHWDIRYEPKALCWILMPETFKGLWRQRLRWARGGVEVLRKYWRDILHWRKRRIWPIYLEFLTSVVWAYVMMVVFVLWAAAQVAPLPAGLAVPALLPGWTGVILGVTCLLQFAISLVIDSRYERGIGRYYFWVIWYPLAYWLLNVGTNVIALPGVLMRGRSARARWVSPDRGVQPADGVHAR